jgi:hypothetical protein
LKYSSYDDREKPVRLDRTEGTVVIEGRVYPAREVVEALAQSGYSDIRTEGDSLVLGRRRIAPIFKSAQDRAMASLCHGSLAFCCPMSKRCAERNRALEILGLTNEEYERLKSDAHYRFVDASKGYDDRTANRPAIDRGYGSDDYRRDFDTLDHALQSQDSYHSSYPPRDPQNPFTDVRSNGSLMEEMRLAAKDLTAGSTCSITQEEVVDGLGSLFRQGELSPFKDDTRDDDSSSFCFSCGRTLASGCTTCSYCGARQ